MHWRHRSRSGRTKNTHTGCRCRVVPYFDLLLNCPLGRIWMCTLNRVSCFLRNGSPFQWRHGFKRCLARLCLVHVVKRRACTVTRIGEWRTSAIEIPVPSKLRNIHQQVSRVVSILVSKHRRSWWPSWQTPFHQLRNTINARLRMKIGLPYLQYILHIVNLLDHLSR